MKNAFIITAAVILGLIGSLALIGNNWPPPEFPPRQGEALDPVALERDHILHSPEALSRVIREPQNTWSNLAFVAAGAYLVTRAFSRGSALVGVALIAVGIGSFFYHASASRTLRHADVAAMYALFFATSILCIGSWDRRLRETVERRIIPISLVAVAVAVCGTVGRNVVILGLKPFSLVVATVAASTILILSVVIAAYRSRSGCSMSAGGFSIGLFIAALVCQLGDRPGRWLCAPDSIVQGHAVWHVLSAMAVLLAVIVLEEKTPNQSPEPTSGLHPAAAHL